jgi:GNAT superfamily N-acetyltransferase
MARRSQRAGRETGALDVRLSDDPEWDRLSAFYDAYDRAFVLADEKETLAGFKACLALNHGAAHRELSQRYGPFRELVALALDTDGAVAGGANFIAFRDGPRVTTNLNYIFVEAGCRRRGVFRALIGVVQREARRAAGAEPDAELRIFIEMNDPLRMDPEAYALDSRHTGLDQFDRLRIWDRLGARLVDFDYRQPALSSGQAAEEGLLYGVLGAPEARTIDPCLLEAHLARFFSISVLKGRDARAEPVGGAQLDWLAERCRQGEGVALLPIGPGCAAARGGGWTLAASFRDLARAAPQD